MRDRILIDTNLWVYLYASNPKAKRCRVEEVIRKNFGKVVLSTQILGELYHVMTRKGFHTEASAREIIVRMVDTFPVLEIGTANFIEAINIHEMYGYTYWDSLVIATAVLGDCQTLYSEDMQHNQSVQERTLIINPFLESS